MNVQRLRLELRDARIDSVTAALHRPERHTGLPVLLAPGAGGDLDGVGLISLAEVLEDLGHPVMRVNLPHHERGAPAPRADHAVDAFREIASVAHTHIDDDEPWVLGGKSYGGRVASLAVAEGEPAAGLLFYGYPLHPPAKRSKTRDVHWPRVGVRCCFLQGSRDDYCDLELLEERLRKLPRRSTLYVVAGGDHSLHVPASASPTGEVISSRDALYGLRGRLAAWFDQITTS